MIDQKYYKKYKKFLFPATLWLLTFFIIFQVILPQVFSIGSILADIKDKKEEVEKLQISLNNLTTQDDNVLLSDFQTASSALPTVKDIGAMFSALSSAAEKANVSIIGFSLKVGRLFGSGQASQQEAQATGVPYIAVNAKTSANNSRDIVDFVAAVHKSFPLAEVTSFESGDGDANVDINFFYKPIDSAAITKDEAISPLTTTEQKLINELHDWE